MINVILKNIGIVIRKFVSVIVVGVCFIFCLWMRYCVIVCVLLVFFSKVLNIVFSFIIVVIKFRVLFMLFCMVFIIVGLFSLLFKLAVMVVISKVRKVGMCYFRMSSKRSKMLSMVASIGIG